MKATVKRLLNKFGYDVALHPIARQPYDGPKIAFVHMAKCGGMSVDHAIRKAIAQPNQPRIDRNTTLAASMASFGKPIESVEDSLAFSEQHAHMLTGIFRHYLAKQWGYVSGHVTVNADLMSEFASQYRFVTVMRNPVERFKSNYIYNKLTNANQFMLPNTLSNGDLIEEANGIINSQRGWQMANVQTMFLTGRFPTSVEDAKTLQNEVINNLKQFAIVGFLDDMTGFEHKFSQLSQRSIHIDKRNTVASHKSAQAEHIKQTLNRFFELPETREKLATICEVEIATYHMAKKLFQ